MFKRWEPQKAAIRVRKTYDGVEFPDSYIIKTEKCITEIIEHIKRDPEIYGRDRAREDVLNGLPEIEINTQDQGFVPNEPELSILATIHYTFTTPKYKQKKKGIIPAILILLAAIFIFNIFIFQDIAKKERIRAMCKIYYKQGEPTHVMFGNREYDLNNLKTEDFIFMSPLEKEFLESTKISECIRINRR